MKKLIITGLLLSQTNVFANTNRNLQYSGSCHASNSATISFVGDILIHKAIYEAVNNGSKDFSQIWRSTNQMINKADFSVGNLEGPTALGLDSRGRHHGDVGFTYDGDIYSGTNFVFNFHPRIANDLKKSGYDLMTFANNHTLDRYATGVDRTLENLRNAGLATVGARTSYEGNDRFYSINRIRGINVAFIGCTEALNGRTDKKKQVVNCYDGQMETIIRNLDSDPNIDFIVALPHWGTEYAPSPNANQVKFAKRFANAGASAIIGSHPHVLQPWEKYKTPSGRETLIVYSLGNFVAWQAGINKKTGPIVYLNITQSGHEKAVISKVGYSLTQRQGTEVLPVTNSHREYIRNAQAYYGDRGFILPHEPLSKVLCN